MITRSNLRAGGTRLIAAGIAVVVAVAFTVAVTSLLDAFNTSMRNQVLAQYSGADLVVTGSNTDLSTELSDKLNNVQGVRDAQAVEQGVAMAGSDQQVVAPTTLPRHADLMIVEGQAPTDDNGILLSADFAKQQGLDVRDPITLKDFTGQNGTGAAEKTYTITGLTDVPSAVAVGYVMDVSDFQPWVDHIRIQVDNTGTPSGTSSSALTQTQRAVAEALAGSSAVTTTSTGYLEAGDYQVYTQQQMVDDWMQTHTGDSAALIGFVVGFIVVAVFVAAMVISNTFQVLVASRTRTLALIRAVGATRGQIRNSTLGEGLALGVIGAVVGIGTGWAIAAGLSLLVSNQVFSGFPVARLTWLAVVLGLAVGVAVTVAASFVPALKATRVSPIDALAPADIPAPDTRIPWIRASVGTALTLLGLVLLVVGAFLGALVMSIPGGLLMFVGVMVLSRVTIPPLIAATGHVLARVTGSAAVGLVARNVKMAPRRMASTTSAFLIGVTLVTTIIVGAQTTRTTVFTELAQRYPVDLIATDASSQARSTVADSPLVTASVSVPGVQAKVRVDGEDEIVPVVGVDTDTVAEVSRNPGLTPTSGVVKFSDTGSLASLDGRDVTFTVGSEQVTLKAATSRGVPEGIAVAAPTDIKPLGPTEKTGQVWAKLTDNVTVAQVAELTTKVDSAGALSQASGAAQRASINQVLNILTAVILGLLGAAVVIAVVGVGNTLSLATLERKRETALVRAMGMSRSSAAFMVTTEAVLMGVVSLVLGLALGTLFGWAGVSSLLKSEDMPVILGIPWTLFALVGLAAPLAAVAASAMPAFAVSRTSPVQAMATQ